MSISRKILSGILTILIIAIVIYALFAFGGGGANRGGEGGLASPSVRSIVTLSVLGASAFITGFGFRDVVGRAAGAHQRRRLAAAREQKSP